MYSLVFGTHSDSEFGLAELYAVPLRYMYIPYPPTYPKPPSQPQ
jgi:hypothetical protein